MPPRRGQDWPTAAPFVPVTADLGALAGAASGCKGCPLWEPATQTVFGLGGAGSRVVLVGEQPGDMEDRRGEPFVGPAGRELDVALAEAGIDRSQAYVTNAVKHFKFTVSGKRRIHASPDSYEMAACKPWLTAELALLQPEVVVLLGATAGKAVFGSSFRVTQSRGVLLPWPAGPQSGSAQLELGADDAPEGSAGGFALATIHPSAVLRAEDRDTAHAGLVADLKVAASALA